jgi:hypothetical protein
MKLFPRCRICNKRIWFDNVKNWAFPTGYDCCINCFHKYDVYCDYAIWKYKEDK